jgi:hypothetical protein
VFGSRKLLRPSGRVVALGAVAALTAAASASSAAAQISATPAAPHIVARPDSVMVNGTTTLTGTGFPAKSKVQLRECGASSWIAPKNPCISTNEITVTASASGGFTTPFKVQLCPRTLPPTPPVTEETCYVGELRPTGIDTLALLGAAKITVTYP